jgi:hypothetical protein
MRRTSLGLTAALTLLLPSDALGQTVAWIDQFGSGGIDVANGVVATATDVYVAGYTYGVLPGEANAGGVDAFLRRLDSQGNEVWQVQFGTSGDEVASGVAMDSTGLYVAGSIDGRFPGEAKVGSEDGFLAKYGFDGAAMWVAQIGTRRWDVVSSVVADGSGVYVLGYTEGVFPGEVKLGSGDLFLTRFTANGEQDWITQFGSSRTDSPHASASVLRASWSRVTRSEHVEAATSWSRRSTSKVMFRGCASSGPARSMRGLGSLQMGPESTSPAARTGCSRGSAIGRQPTLSSAS